MTDCYIVAHGGFPKGDHKFVVPPGLMVQFYSDHGKTNDVGVYNGPVSLYSQQGKATRTDRRHTGGSNCRDYILGKALGKGHWDGWSDLNIKRSDTYLAVKDQLDDTHQNNAWTPHFVTVRSRLSPGVHGFVWLSEVIRLVNSHDNTIVNFYTANCRDKCSTSYLWRVGAQAFQP